MNSLSLIICRHAKSQHAIDLDDHSRPLNPRGRSNAECMGIMLERCQSIPDTILCSTSTRTRETLEIMSDQWSQKPNIEYLDQIYLANESQLYDCLQANGNGTSTMIIGHNPGMESLTASVAHLADHSIRFPTGAMAFIELGIRDWSDLTLGCGRLLWYHIPRMIEKIMLKTEAI